MSDDTSPAVRARQIELLRSLPPARRLAMVADLTRTAIGLSRRALRARMPDAGESAVLLRWVELVYGEDLAARLRAAGLRLGGRA